MTGSRSPSRRGSVAHDPIIWDAAAGQYRRRTTLAGGVEGGISTGELVVVRAAMKPLATLNIPVLETVDTVTKESTVSFKERTDVTAVPAMGVVAETMVALVLAPEAQRKFGGDNVDEFVRNAECVPGGAVTARARRAGRADGLGQDDRRATARRAPRAAASSTPTRRSKRARGAPCARSG